MPATLRGQVSTSGRLLFTIICGIPLSCGGRSHNVTPVETAGATQLGGGAGAISTAGGAGGGGRGSAGGASAGSSNGGANSAQAGAGAGGSAGAIVIGNGPTPCTTSDGRPGIMVDVFPFPGPVAQCEPLHQPGAADANCPADTLYRCGFDDCVGVEDLPGCCRADGQCGLFESGYFGAENALGCLNRQPWIDGARYLAEAPKPASCVP